MWRQVLIKIKLLLNIKIKTNKDKPSRWDKVTAGYWKSICYPWRPNKNEQNIFSFFIKEKRNKIDNDYKSLLLGSTPEIRDIFARNNLSLDVVDSSKNMYQTMKAFCRSNEKEYYFQQDWISFLSDKKDEYDQIIGDLPLRLLSNKKVFLLGKYIIHSLKINGDLILRSHFVKPSQINRKKSHAEILKIVRQLESAMLSNNEVIDRLFFLFSACFVKKNNKVDINTMKIFLNQMLLNLKSKKLKMLIKLLINKWIHPSSVFFVRSRREEHQAFSQLLHPIKTRIFSLFDNQTIEIALWRKL